MLSQDGNNLSRDTDTGLDWLDVTLSLDRSYNEVSTQFGAGGDYEGFRFATRPEVVTLFDHADLVLEDPGPVASQPILDFLAQFGSFMRDKLWTAGVYDDTLDGVNPAYVGFARVHDELEGDPGQEVLVRILADVQGGPGGDVLGDPAASFAYSGSWLVTPNGAPTNGVITLDSYGQTYTQKFDNLDLGGPGTPLPLGWDANAGGTILTTITITEPIPTAAVATGTYNAGAGGDRTLATGNTNSAAPNALRLWGTVTGGTDVRAVVLETRVEAWFGDAAADNPGEAALLATLEFDPTASYSFNTAETFNGGAPISTGLVLTPGPINGNNIGGTAFSSGLVILAAAIPAGSDIRIMLDAQAVGQTTSYIFGVDDFLFRIVAPGDTDGDGEFNSDDLFAILGAGKFNHPEFGPATWGEGDFTGDALVDSNDLFAMLGAAKFNAGPYTVASSSAAEASMTATIDPATGNVLLDASAAGAAGEVVSGWKILSASGIFTGDMADINPGSFFDTIKDTEVSTGFIAFTGTNDLGNIIGQEHLNQPVGFYADDISGIFTMDGAEGNFVMNIQVIPEPSSLMLASLSLVGLFTVAWWRRSAKLVQT